MQGLNETTRYCVNEIQKITVKSNFILISWPKCQLHLQCKNEEEAQEWLQTLETARAFWDIKFPLDKT